MTRRRRRASVPEIGDQRLTKALSHPLRVRILATLTETKASPNELSKQLGASLGTVAYHVRTLEDLGLIELVDETRVRGAVEHHYRSRERPSITAEQWFGASAVAKQALMGSTLQTIAESAAAAAAAGGFDGASAFASRRTYRLDPGQLAELAELVEFLFDRAHVLEEKSTGIERVDVELAALLFERKA